MTRFQPRFLARFGPLLLSLSSAALTGACASSGSAPGSSRLGPRQELLVTLHNFKAGERFELASESHTERIAYYSDERSDAARKVQTDEVMSAFLRELERLGFGAHARTGRAPAIGTSDVIRWGLEIASGSGEVHWLVGTGSPAADWKEFDGCRDTFLQLYNSTVSYQAVANESGKQYFEEKTRAAAGRKQER